MKKIFFIVAIIVFILCLNGCSKEFTGQAEDVTVPVVETTETTVGSTTKPTTEKTTETTMKAEIITTKPNTTASSISVKKKKTTKKVTTTQKQRTSKPYYCYEGGSHHTSYVGPIGWYKTYDGAMEGVVKYCTEHPNFKHYTVEKCSCGLYTATFKETPTKSTTMPYYCDEGGSHHRLNVGQIGWCNSYNEAMEARIKYCKEHPNLKHYTIESCNCGKYTAYIN